MVSNGFAINYGLCTRFRTVSTNKQEYFVTTLHMFACSVVRQLCQGERLQLKAKSLPKIRQRRLVHSMPGT